MSDVSNSNLYKKIYDLCKEYHEYEKHLIQADENIIYSGFLIEKKLIEKLKINIFYDKLDTKAYDFKILKKHIEKYCKEKEIKKIENISQMKFNDAKQLIDAINKDKSFYIINKKLWNTVNGDNVDKKLEIGIDYMFNKDKIILMFRDKEELEFKKNKGIIEKSNLINKDNDNNNIKTSDQNNNNINNNSSGSDNNSNNANINNTNSNNEILNINENIKKFFLR